MENLLSRYRNVSVLVGVLFLQVLGLAIQVKRAPENESSRLIRVWVVSTVTPLERAVIGTKNGTANMWHEYLYLRGVRQENRQLKEQIQNLRLEEVRVREDAEQAHRLQALLGFKEQFVAQTMAAQVIGSSGSDRSRSVYIDKGSHEGIRTDMPVITADGIVGKVLRVFGGTSQVLLINDQTSGAGALLEQSRLQGILRGTASGEIVLEKVMSDETVQSGEPVLTSGGDQIFPKGLRIGTVIDVNKGKDSFLNVRVRPAANLAKLEEVLIITKREDREPMVADSGTLRAVDVLADRLPSVPQKPVEGSGKGAANAGAAGTPGQIVVTKPAPVGAATGPVQSVATKPATGPAGPGQPKLHQNTVGTPENGVQVPKPVSVPATTKKEVPPRHLSDMDNADEKTTPKSVDGKQKPTSPKPVEAVTKPSEAQPQ